MLILAALLIQRGSNLLTVATMLWMQIHKPAATFNWQH